MLFSEKNCFGGDERLSLGDPIFFVDKTIGPVIDKKIKST